LDPALVDRLVAGRLLARRYVLDDPQLCPMTLHEKHIERIDLVNSAPTLEDHRESLAELRAWRDGVADAGVRLDFIAADLHYIDQGIDRPMCCGVFNDWTEATPSQS
jgi:hypothetical protein